jgi:hypothetical protein
MTEVFNMNKEEIIKLAQEAGLIRAGENYTEPARWGISEITDFYSRVAAAEREACAEACEEVESRAEELWDKFAYPEDQGMASGARQCANAIRARGDR